MTAGPIAYQPPLEDGATLVLKDLKQPGNYTFKLTVEDSDHVKNSSTANITVLNHIDYPPEANAGNIKMHRYLNEWTGFDALLFKADVISYQLTRYFYL